MNIILFSELEKGQFSRVTSILTNHRVLLFQGITRTIYKLPYQLTQVFPNGVKGPRWSAKVTSMGRKKHKLFKTSLSLSSWCCWVHLENAQFYVASNRAAASLILQSKKWESQQLWIAWLVLSHIVRAKCVYGKVRSLSFALKDARI